MTWVRFIVWWFDDGLLVYIDYGVFHSQLWCRQVNETNDDIREIVQGTDIKSIPASSNTRYWSSIGGLSPQMWEDKDVEIKSVISKFWVCPVWRTPFFALLDSIDNSKQKISTQPAINPNYWVIFDDTTRLSCTWCDVQLPWTFLSALPRVTSINEFVALFGAKESPWLSTSAWPTAIEPATRTIMIWPAQGYRGWNSLSGFIFPIHYSSGW